MPMSFKKIITEKEHGFTLIELIVVIIIVGILAAVGISQYSLMVEKGRTTEAKIRLGTMRQLAYEYYLVNGSLAGIQLSDLGVDNTCTSNSFFKYTNAYNTETYINLYATRCTSGGKTPNTSREYTVYLPCYPASDCSRFGCAYSDDSSVCFGMHYP